MPCRLSPLATCLPTVAQEFQAQAAALRLLDPSRFAGASPGVRIRAQRPLEMFFPFDPYLLCTSAGRLGLDSTYLRWQQSASQPAAAGAFCRGCNEQIRVMLEHMPLALCMADCVCLTA